MNSPLATVSKILTWSCVDGPGNRLVINLTTGSAGFNGGGPATPGGTSSSGGRVTGRFTVPDRN